MSDYQQKFIVAACDTLMNIGGVCGLPARELSPASALTDDLGMNDADFHVLAAYLCRVGDRMRSDGKKTRINADDLVELTVIGTYTLTVERAIGIDIQNKDAVKIMAEARNELQGGAP